MRIDPLVIDAARPSCRWRLQLRSRPGPSGRCGLPSESGGRDPGRGHRPPPPRALGGHPDHLRGSIRLDKESSSTTPGSCGSSTIVMTTLTTSAHAGQSGSPLRGSAGVLIRGYEGRLIMLEQLTLGTLFSFTLFLGFLHLPHRADAHNRHPETEASRRAGAQRAPLLTHRGRRTPPDDTMPPSRGTCSSEDVHFRYEGGPSRCSRGVSFEAQARLVIALGGKLGLRKEHLGGAGGHLSSPRTRGGSWWMGVRPPRRCDPLHLPGHSSRPGCPRTTYSSTASIRREPPLAPGGRLRADIQAAARTAHVLGVHRRVPPGTGTVIRGRGVELSGAAAAGDQSPGQILANPDPAAGEHLKSDTKCER